MKKIKKSFVPTIVLLGFVIFLTGCSLSMSSNALNPPSWIIGSWSDSSDTISFEFKSDNIIQKTSGISIDYQEVLESESSATYNETSQSSTYSIYISDSSGNATYTFTKVTDTTIECTITSSGITIGPIELEKE
jgi:hypothetical protein